MNAHEQNYEQISSNMTIP